MGRHSQAGPCRAPEKYQRPRGKWPFYGSLSNPNPILFQSCKRCPGPENGRETSQSQSPRASRPVHPKLKEPRSLHGNPRGQMPRTRPLGPVKDQRTVVWPQKWRKQVQTTGRNKEAQCSCTPGSTASSRWSQVPRRSGRGSDPMGRVHPLHRWLTKLSGR